MAETRSADGEPSGDTDTDSERGDSAANTPPRSLFVALVLGGLILPGVVSYFLDSANFVFLSDVVFVSGYAVVVFLAWYGWIRPIDIVGPD